MKTETLNGEVLIGRIGVDSGQIMVGDPCYLKQWGGHEWDGTKPTHKDFSYDYAGACQATTQDGVPRSGGELGGGLAVASSTAHGDGVFNVYQVWEDGEMLRIEIRFVEEFNESDFSEDDSE